jgi:hypothetical protein
VSSATWLAGILLAGALIRIAFIDEPMRYDEAFTLDHYAIHGYGFIASTYDFPNNHILYTLLTHTVWLITGDHVWTARLVALAAGVAIIPATYLAGRELYGVITGLCAAALAAVFAPLVDYSVDGRGYTLGIVFVLLLVPLTASVLRRDSAQGWAGVVMGSTLAVYTVPTMAYGVATVALWAAGVAVIERRGAAVQFLVRLGGALAVASALTVLLYSPVLGQRGWTVVPGLTLSWTHVHSLGQAVWGDWNRAAAGVKWVLALACLAGLVTHRRVARQPVPILLPAAVIVGIVFLLGRISPFARTWLYLAPFYLLTGAAGLVCVAEAASRRLRRPVAASLPAVAVVAAVTGIMAVTLIGRGEHGADGAPMTDNTIASFVRTHIGAHGTLALDTFMNVPAAYYFRVRHYAPPMYTPGDTGNVLVLLVGRQTGAAATRRVDGLGVPPVTASGVTLVARLPYITAYRVYVTPR